MRRDLYDDERCETFEFDGKETEINENSDIVGSSARQKDQNRLRPRETIRLIIEMRKSEAERAQRRSGQRQIQEDESESLLPASKKHSLLSPSWCRTASCTLY